MVYRGSTRCRKSRRRDPKWRSERFDERKFQNVQSTRSKAIDMEGSSGSLVARSVRDSECRWSRRTRAVLMYIYIYNIRGTRDREPTWLLFDGKRHV